MPSGVRTWPTVSAVAAMLSRDEMGANPPPLGAEAHQLTLRQEGGQAPGDGLRPAVRRGQVAVSQTAGDRRASVRVGDTGPHSVRQATILGRRERPKSAGDGPVVQHAVSRQKRRARVEQLVENLDVRNAGMRAGQGHELDGAVAQPRSQLRQERDRPAQGTRR
jgi:hypothetical protein